VREQEREENTPKRERVTIEREREKERITSSNCPTRSSWFLPSVIIEEWRGETTPMEPTAISFFFKRKKILIK
jgi:hypothetical protein